MIKLKRKAKEQEEPQWQEQEQYVFDVAVEKSCVRPGSVDAKTRKHNNAYGLNEMT